MKVKERKQWPQTIRKMAGGGLLVLGTIIFIACIVFARSADNAGSPELTSFLTGLGFFCCGICLSFSMDGKLRHFPLATLILALLICVQSLTASFGREIFLSGTVSPLAAAILAVASLCFLAAQKSQSSESASFLITMAASLFLGIGSVILVGHLAGFKVQFPWENRLETGFIAGLAFLILGLGLYALVWEKSFHVDFREVRWLPVPVFLGVATMGLVLWQILKSQEHLRIHRTVEQHLDIYQFAVESTFQARADALLRNARHWERISLPSSEDWKISAQLFLKDFPDCQALTWLKPGMEQAWLVESPNQNIRKGSMEGTRIIHESEALRSSREPRILTSATEDLAYFIHPVFSRGNFEGWINSEFSVPTFLKNAIPTKLLDDYSIVLMQGQRIFFQNEPPPPDHSKWMQETKLNLSGLQWKLRVIPREAVVAEEVSWVPEAALFLGITIAGLLAMQIRHGQQAIHRSKSLQQVNLELQGEINHRKKVEDSLRSSELHFRSVTESAHDAIISCNNRGDVIFWNNGAREMFGFQESDMLHHPMTDLIPERFRELHRKRLETTSVGSTGQLFGRTIELCGLRKDATEFPIELSLASWQIGGEVFFTAIMRDVTERKKSQRALEDARQELENRVEERTRQLGQLNDALMAEIKERTKAEAELQQHRLHLEELVEARTDELQETNTELESFSYTVSHDLRAPLRAMQGFSAALLDDYGNLLDSTGRDYAQRIVHSARRMDELIQDLLIYSRISRNDLKLLPVNPVETIKEALEQLEADITSSGASIVLEKKFPMVLGHHATLVQVFSNLIANSIKFVAPGTVPKVHIGVDTGPEKAIFWVSDNGIGIAPEHHSRIFKVFERLHTLEKYPGTGIGLAIVRKAMERMGGSVGLISEPGAGTRFWIELAITPSPGLNSGSASASINQEPGIPTQLSSF